jgi:hypothetical protein
MSYHAELQAFIESTEDSEPDSILGQLRTEALGLFVLPERSIEALAQAAQHGLEAVRVAHFGLDIEDESEDEYEDE